MLGNLLTLLLVLALAVVLAALAWRAFRSRSAVVKWGGGLLSGLLALVLALVAVVGGVGLAKFYAPQDAPVPALAVAGTPEQVARGEHIANVFCASCHATNNALPLTGGVDIGRDLPLPLGQYVSVNLTPAGPLAEWSDGEIFRAIRNGIDQDGQALFVMSGARGRHLSDEDLEAVIAYLRSQPAVENDTLLPPDRPSLLALVMLGAGLIPANEPPITGVITAPPKGPTVEYGAYIMSYQDCVVCHGEDLTGGVEGQLAPIGPSLRHVRDWTAEQFMTVLRTGVSVDGHELQPPMPWQNIGRMDDEELLAVYEYIRSLP
jgi:mono/diheme cytochrome c family protein